MPELALPNAAQQERRRALVVPREHGAWGILLVPLLTGAAVGLLAGGRPLPVLPFGIAVVALFWLRTPLETWVGAGSIRAQSPWERQLVRRVGVLLSAVVTIAWSAVFWGGRNWQLLWFGAAAGVAFAIQAGLKRSGRRTRMAAQMAGAFGLTSTASAAYYVVTGRLDNTAWALWLANWLFAGDQIHFVGLRIRAARIQCRRKKLSVGWSFLAGQMLVAGILLGAWRSGFFPGLALLAFIPVLFRGTLWFLSKPRPVVIRHLGWTELAHAVVFGTLLVVGFYSWQ